MTKEDFKRIEQKASKVLSDNYIIEPFVNVFDIANGEGISIEYRKMPQGNTDVSGFFDSTTRTIYVNVDNSIARRTYTVAHELGHYFLEHKPDEYGLYRRNNSYDEIKEQKEKEADCFAANLLMPENMIRKELREYPFLKSSIQLLADRFGVSPSAMAYRLMNLRIIKR
ncbi:ImmA/IrrE family metallo-endopeptidase [Candidatus Saccharibacteria bacterium oral taxon 488]|jgi:hypothetical protein cdivTM_07089|nr:ImmA/IrrE family metallo-endopeptidase [Candidatus Saccharibacteria bacterium oral taxon 488]